MKPSLIPPRWKPYLKAWGRATLVTGIVVLLAALFAIRFFFVRGGSMRGTLLKGDFVYVDKLGYGARLPEHPVAIPYSQRYYLSSVELPYLRLPGLKGIERKDVLVFDDPMEEGEMMMSRCIGLPGDTVTIDGVKVRVNGNRFDRPPGVITYYHVKLASDSADPKLFEQYGIEKKNRVSNLGDYVVPLKKREALRLRKDPKVSYVETWQREGQGKEHFFPPDPDYDWSAGNVGPLWVPEAGVSVKLDTNVLPLYKRIIEVYEGHELSVTDTNIRIDGELRESYTFEMDYFYVLGDPRPFSKDSRIWGFLPEDRIIGRALFVLYSYDMKEGGFRWERTFRGIR